MIDEYDYIHDYVASSGWRKRQIALNVKAENARELKLDYEPTDNDFMQELGALPFDEKENT